MLWAGGQRVTVTDANLYLGRIVPEHFLGGGMQLDEPSTRQGVESLAKELGMAPAELAEGVLAVANTNMERAIRVISVEKGHDPREFTLLSFGGAGGMHCAALARLLRMERVFIPVNPGILSATGMLMADVVKDYSRTIMRQADSLAKEELEALFAELEAQALEELASEGIRSDDVRHQRYLDMRYAGQSFEIIVPFGTDPVESFQSLHEKRYGHRNPDKGVEVVNVRLRSRGSQIKPDFATAPDAGPHLPKGARLGTTRTIFDGKPHATAVIDRARLQPGNRFQGPAIVVEYTSTIVIPPSATVTVDSYSNLLLALN